MVRTIGGAAKGLGVVASLLVALAGATRNAAAEDDRGPMNRVSFRVERSREVPNDRVEALVGLTDEDSDAARLAARVNETMARALATAKATSGVTVETGGYSTFPIHQDGRIRRWRASQTLRLQSSDIAVVTRLVGQLQAELQLQSIQFSVSPERRRSVEDALIAEALAAFRKRADLVRESLGARGYQIAEIAVDTGGGGGPPRPMMMEARAMGAAPAPPAVEGGSSELSVHVSGTIELE